MDAHKILSLAGIAMACGCSADADGSNQQEVNKRPNFVIMIADDCSYNDLGCYGSPDAVTPNINALAAEGMKFNKCFQQAPMSSPTRHALYTGVYPVKSGAYPNHTFVYDHIKSFVQYFGDAGYKTALIGKEHVAPASVFSYEYLGNYKDKLNTPLDDFKYGNIDSFIDRTADDPFFLVVASREPHTPHVKGNSSLWNPEDITLAPIYVDTPHFRKQFIKYLAEINFLDSQVGNVVRILKEKGIFDNTVFIFLSEQGNQFPYAKWTCYKQGLQSGMLIRWPKMVEKKSETKALVEYVDIVPTCMEIAGIAKSQQIEGKSFYKVLNGSGETHKEYTFGLQTTRGINNGSDYYGIRSIRDGRYSYILNLTPEATFKNAYTENANSSWQSWLKKAGQGELFAIQQVTNFQHRPAEELYDMETDPYEMDNLLLKKSIDQSLILRKEKLRLKLLEWMKQQGDKGQQTELDAYQRILNKPNA